MKSVIVQYIYAEKSANLTKIWDSKILIPLDSPGYVVLHTRSLTMPHLGVQRYKKSNTGDSNRKSAP